MNGALVWLLVGLGLAVIVVRRRSLAVGLVTVQALVLAASAVHSSSGADVAAAFALAVRAVVLGALLLFVVSRTREPRPVRAGIAPLARGGIAVALALALTWLIPPFGLDSRSVERGVIALVAFGVATVAMRRATLFHVLGIVLAENGLALAALRLPQRLFTRDRARRRVRPDAGRAGRDGLPRAHLRRVRSRRLGRAEDAA